MQSTNRNEWRVAAVFATMNRSATACAAVHALAAQTRPPDLVVVTDNASADTTATDLANLEDLPFEQMVEAMPENLGNAGGMAAAMDAAFARGADAVWILDDDSPPRPGALEALLTVGIPEEGIATTMQRDPIHGGLTWPVLLPAPKTKAGWELVDDPGRLEKLGESFEVRAAWTGILLPREAWHKVGPVDASWFIRGEDEDYAERLTRAGYRFFMVRDAVLDHPGPKRMIRWSVGGKTFFHEPGLADWKMHYMIRNRVRRARRGGRTGLALALAALHGLAVIRHDGIGKLTVWARACREGWTG